MNMSRSPEDVLDSCRFRNYTASLEEVVERYDTTRHILRLSINTHLSSRE